MAKPKPFQAAPGGSDMTLQEGFARTLSLARMYLDTPRNIATERDRMAIALIEALAVGSHSYKPEAK